MDIKTQEFIRTTRDEAQQHLNSIFQQGQAMTTRELAFRLSVASILAKGITAMVDSILSSYAIDDPEIAEAMRAVITLVDESTDIDPFHIKIDRSASTTK